MIIVILVLIFATIQLGFRL